MLLNARVTAFTVSELLRENQQGSQEHLILPNLEIIRIFLKNPKQSLYPIFNAFHRAQIQKNLKKIFKQYFKKIDFRPKNGPYWV